MHACIPNRITTVCSGAWRGGVWKTLERVYIIHFIFDSSGCVHFSHTSYVSCKWNGIYTRVFLCINIYIYDKARVTGKRNFSEIQKSNPRRRDNSIKKKGEAKKPRQANRMSTAHIRV